MPDGEEGARMLIAAQQPPTALFAISDMLALGAMTAVQQAGLQIPSDMAVTSFNDIPIAKLVNPPLTTVAAPAYLMGQEAMRMLQALISGEQPLERQITLPTKLVVRHSCGC
jgi:LacI family transcriptional regulator